MIVKVVRNQGKWGGKLRGREGEEKANEGSALAIQKRKQEGGQCDFLADKASWSWKKGRGLS